jgi:ATP-dependent Clp protease ATP-binding subunit ClpA
MTMKSDKFTESAKEALRFSQELVRRYRHAQWDVEHVFLALLEQEDSVPRQVLQELEEVLAV